MTRTGHGLIDVRSYLDRLAVADPGPPSPEGLRRLHVAHVERVPYETVGIALRRADSVDPVEASERIVAGYGGYCFHLNGAFAALLSALGYDVTLHQGTVRMSADTQVPGDDGNHLAPTVRLGEQEWLVDVGLGNALHEPLPLRPGSYRQGPFTYRLDHAPTVPGGWRFTHSPLVDSFACMDFRPEPARPEDFAAKHRELSTDPQSPFVRVVAVARRDHDGVDVLRGTKLTRFDATGRHDREVTDRATWFTLAAQHFGLHPTDLDDAARAAVWERVTGRPRG
jgi:arylamine N-acetyltransferase